MRIAFAQAAAFLLLSAAAVCAQVPKEILNEELALAARAGNVDRVRLLLDKGADAQARDLFGQPVILLGSRMTYDDRSHAVIDLLLAKGADINSANTFGTTPLMITQTASGYNNSDEFFRKRGSDFSRTDIFGGNYEFYYLFGTQPTYPPFAEKGKARLLTEREIIWRYLLEDNLAKLEDPHCCGRMGNSATVVMALAYYGYHDLFEEAVRKDGSLLWEKDALGNTALHYAALGDCDRCLFLGFEGNTNVRNDAGETPLITATKMGHDLFVHKMIRRGADSALKDLSGKTALLYAAAWGRTEVLMPLLMHGVDTSIPDPDGYPPIALAAKKGHFKTVNGFIVVKGIGTALLKTSEENRGVEQISEKLSKMDLDLSGPDGMTALMYASAAGEAETVKALLMAGADKTRKNRAGKSALDIASAAGMTAIRELLTREW